ncbi:hypothetical protein NE237_003359 [Protea cynaroides]|uniref:O-methyltransferase C-terminal domain-containing protein n=1 Tax=Protea cynaroides TaxID=273540 RepID=A0A9Q0QSI5_9MAGN|nr:hypothetical protein NE237_003359 [Protea cynaroides]
MKLRHHDHGQVLELVFERPPEAMNAARSSDSDENYGIINFLKTTDWDFAAAKPKFNRLFNDGLACTSKGVLSRLCYQPTEKDSRPWDQNRWWCHGIRIGGGGCGGRTGMAVAENVKTHLHAQGINFDVPHVVDTASQYLGVSHVGGDMDWWMADHSTESSFNRIGLRGVRD